MFRNIVFFWNTALCFGLAIHDCKFLCDSIPVSSGPRTSFQYRRLPSTIIRKLMQQYSINSNRIPPLTSTLRPVLSSSVTTTRSTLRPTLSSSATTTRSSSATTARSSGPEFGSPTSTTPSPASLLLDTYHSLTELEMLLTGSL